MRKKYALLIFISIIGLISSTVYKEITEKNKAEEKRKMELKKAKRAKKVYI